MELRTAPGSLTVYLEHDFLAVADGHGLDSAHHGILGLELAEVEGDADDLLGGEGVKGSAGSDHAGAE